MKVSIIILSFNTKELLELCLKSVKEAILKMKAEVIVVDNNSSDGSGEMVAGKFPWVKLIGSKNNLGFAGGNNLGLKSALGEYVLFLNSDMLLKKKAVKESLKLIESDSKIGAVTPKILLMSGRMDPDCHRGFPTPWASMTYFLGLENIFLKSKLLGRYHKRYLDLNRNHEIEAGCGAFMLVRKKVLDEVGRMDEKYFFYGEDLDLYYRIKEAGWKVMFLAKPLAYHYKGASSGLRKESRGVTRASKEVKIRAAKASVNAMEIFYKKFYKGKYNSLVTGMVLLGIKIMGMIRICKYRMGK